MKTGIHLIEQAVAQATTAPLPPSTIPAEYHRHRRARATAIKILADIEPAGPGDYFNSKVFEEETARVIDWPSLARALYNYKERTRYLRGIHAEKAAKAAEPIAIKPASPLKNLIKQAKAAYADNAHARLRMIINKADELGVLEELKHALVKSLK